MMRKIEVIQETPNTSFRIWVDGVLWLEVETPRKEGGAPGRRWSGPDWPAALKRANIIADALRASR